MVAIVMWRVHVVSNERINGPPSKTGAFSAKKTYLCRIPMIHSFLFPDTCAYPVQRTMPVYIAGREPTDKQTGRM